MIVATPTLVPTLAPVETALATVRRRCGAVGTRGLVPGLLAPSDGAGWWPAENLLHSSESGDLDRLLDAAKQRWNASPHAAAALAWRSYTYWLAMPVVLGWAAARRVLLVDPADVRVRLGGQDRLLQFGLRRVRMLVLPDDPLADDPHVDAPPGGAADPELTVADSEAQLLDALRGTLRGSHLDPLLAAIQGRVRLGSRTLLGSLASAVAYAVLRGIEAPPAELTAIAERLLAALDVADLVVLDSDPAGGLAVRRRTCCLAFTLPRPKVCASCCLRDGAGEPGAGD